VEPFLKAKQKDASFEIIPPLSLNKKNAIQFFKQNTLEKIEVLIHLGWQKYGIRMPMTVVEKQITKSELAELAKERWGDLVKAVVDIQQGIMVIGAELHSDEEAHLLDRGSNQQDLWAINLYPQKTGDEFVEFDSVINLRPSQGNPSRDIIDQTVRQKIRDIVNQLVGQL
jgi:hypothetical protein